MMNKRVITSIAISAVALMPFSIPSEAATTGYRFEKGYRVYKHETDTQGCRADYVNTYKGWHKKPLPEAKANKGWSDLYVGEYVKNKKFYIWFSPYQEGDC